MTWRWTQVSVITGNNLIFLKANNAHGLKFRGSRKHLLTLPMGSFFGPHEGFSLLIARSVPHLVSFLPSFPSLVTLAFYSSAYFAGKSQKPESHFYPHGQSQRNVFALYSYHFINEAPTMSPLLLVFTTEGTAWFCIIMLKWCLSNPNLLSQIQTHLFQFILNITTWTLYQLGFNQRNRTRRSQILRGLLQRIGLRASLVLSSVIKTLCCHARFDPWLGN